MSGIHTHYDNLRVARNAPPEVIRAAYKALSQRYHPDKNNSPDATRIMKILNEAYAVLSDSDARSRYDASLAAQQAEYAGAESMKTGFSEEEPATPATPPQPDRTHEVTIRSAGPWIRFFARIFDVWWEVALVAIVGSYWLAENSTWFDNRRALLGSTYALNIFFLPFALVLDAVVYQVFGNTPGKALLGLKVINQNGYRLSFIAYLVRNLSIWVRGFACGLPIISLVTLGRQYSSLRRAHATRYDAAGGIGVGRAQSSWPRNLIFATGFALMLLAILGSNTASTIQSRNVATTQSDVSASTQYPSSTPQTGSQLTEDSLPRADMLTDIDEISNVQVPTYATSFDCSKAHLMSENLICGDAELAQMDRSLAATFAMAKEMSSDKRGFAEAARTNWNWRNQNCFDKICLVVWYAQQQARLEKIAMQSPQIANQSPAVDVRSTTSAATGSESVPMSEDQIQANLIDAMNRINKTTPAMIDQSTRLDSADGYGRQMTYSFTLVGERRTNLDIDKLREAMRQQLYSSVCIGNKLKAFFDSNIPVTYLYRDDVGIELFKFSFTASTCNSTLTTAAGM